MVYRTAYIQNLQRVPHLVEIGKLPDEVDQVSLAEGVGDGGMEGDGGVPPGAYRWPERPKSQNR